MAASFLRKAAVAAVGLTAVGAGAFYVTHDDEDTKGLSIEAAKLVLQAKDREKKENFQEAGFLYAKSFTMVDEETEPALTLSNKAANAYLRAKRCDLAVPYFTKFLRLFYQHKKTEKPVAIEVSLKLAACFELGGHKEHAESGLRWCVKEATDWAKNHPKDADSQALAGLTQESLGLFLLHNGDSMEEAHQVFASAIESAQKLPDTQVQVQLARNFHYASLTSWSLENPAQAVTEAERALNACRQANCSFMDLLQSTLASFQGQGKSPNVQAPATRATSPS